MRHDRLHLVGHHHHGCDDGSHCHLVGGEAVSITLFDRLSWRMDEFTVGFDRADSLQVGFIVDLFGGARVTDIKWVSNQFLELKLEVLNELDIVLYTSKSVIPVYAALRYGFFTKEREEAMQSARRAVVAHLPAEPTVSDLAQVAEVLLSKQVLPETPIQFRTSAGYTAIITRIEATPHDA